VNLGLSDSLTRYPQEISLHGISVIKENCSEPILPVAFTDPCAHSQQRILNAFISQSQVSAFGLLILIGNRSSLEERSQCDIKLGTSCKKSTTILRSKLYHAALLNLNEDTDKANININII